jgi:glucose/arabinose dehydrogenase
MGNQPGITEQSHAGMEQPVVYYTPSVGPSEVAFYTGDRYPAWKNTSLFLCTLVGQSLKRLEISGRTVTHQEDVLSKLGRVHDIEQGADGYFYVALQAATGLPGLPLSASTPGMIARLVPVQ